MAGRIAGITIELGANAGPLKSALRGVDSQLKSMRGGLRDVDRLLKFNPTSTALLTQKQQLLKKSIEETRNRLQTLKEAQKQMDAAGVDKNSEDYQRLQREIEATEQQLKKLNKEYNRFASVAGAKMQAVGQKMQEFGRSVAQVGDSLTRKITMPLTIMGGVAAKKFAEVDKTMQLTNATMGNTEEEAKKINNAMKEAAANSTFGMNDAATASLNFARAGLSAEQAASALAPAMNLAAGEGGELDIVSAGLVATINGFGGSFNDAAKYADVFANACNNSALDIDSLSESMSIAAPVFSAAGYSIEDAALYMGLMANKGIPANKAANSLKTGLARLVKPTDEAAKWMKKLGIEITNADGSMKSSAEVQANLNTAFKDLSKSEKIAASSAIFGKNQFSPWLALIETAPSDVNALSTALAKEGTTSEMASAMMSGFGGSLEKLKSSLDVAATSLGEALAPMIKRVSDRIQDAVNWFNGLSDEQKETVAKTMLLVAALGPLLAIGGRLITGVGKLIGTTGKLFSLVAANPFVALAGALAAATAGLVLYTKKQLDTIGKEYELSKAQKATLTTIDEATEAYKSADNARKDAMSGIVAEFDYAKELRDEYNSLIDTNGKVKSGYEDRAEFIKGQLAEALGIEKGQIDDLIGANGKLKSSIDKIIEVKQAEALLDANKDAYAEAIKMRKEAAEKLAPALTTLDNAEKNYQKTQAEVERTQKSLGQQLQNGQVDYQGYQAAVEKAERANAKAKDSYEKAQKSVDGFLTEIDKANTDISNHEGLMQALASKDMKAVDQYASAMTAGIKTRENATRQELQKQAAMIDEEYQLMLQKRKEGDTRITDQMLKDQKARRDAADKEAGITRKNAEKNAKAEAQAQASGLGEGKSAIANAYNKWRSEASKAAKGMKDESTKGAVGAKNAVVSNLSRAAASAAGSFGKISSSSKTNMSAANKNVSSGVSSIKGKFPFNIGKMFNINVSLPEIVQSGVKKIANSNVPILSAVAKKFTFAKAYDNPMLFTAPTMYSGALVGDRGSHAGGEMIYGRDNLMRDIRSAIGGTGTTINVTVNGSDNPEAWADRLVKEIQLQARTV